MTIYKQLINIRLLTFITLFLLAGSIYSKAVYAEETKDISILHINDTNGNIEPVITEQNGVTKETGGFSRIDYFVKKHREKNPNTFFVSSGDVIAPMPISARTKGELTIDILNNIGLDVWSPGNFDFMYGLKELENRISETDFNVVSTNIFSKKTGEHWIKPYVILEKNNKKVAFLGVTSLKYIKHFPTDVTENIEVRSPVESVTKACEELKGKVDFIVLIAQLSIEDKAEIMSKTDVNLVVGGIELYREAEISNFRTNNAKFSLITRGESQSVSVVDVYWENNLPKFENIKEHILDAKTYDKDLIKPETDKINKIISKYKSTEKEPVIASLDRNPTQAESQKFIAGLSRSLTGSDITIFRKAFFLRNTKLPQNITSQDVYTILSLPFKPALVKLNGSDLKAFLSNRNMNDFITSGLQNNKVNGSKIIDTENYIICTDEYNYDNQPFLRERGKVIVAGKNINDTINEFFINNKDRKYSLNEFDDYSPWKIRFSADLDPQMLKVDMPANGNYNYLPWRADQNAIRWGGILNLNLKRYWKQNEFDNFLDTEFRQQQTGNEPIKVYADRIRLNSIFRREISPDFLYAFSEVRISSLFTNPDPKKNALLLGQLIAGVSQSLPFDIRIKEGLELRKNFFDGTLPWRFGPSFIAQINHNIFWFNESLDARFFIPLDFNSFVTEVENKISLPLTDKVNIFYKLNLYNESNDFKIWATRHNVGLNLTLDNTFLF